MQEATANDIRKVHAFVDPELKRAQLTWDDIEVPARLREIAEESWQALNKLADDGGDTPDVHELLDELRGPATPSSTRRRTRSRSPASLAARRDGEHDAAALAAKARAERGRRPCGPSSRRAPSAGSARPSTATDDDHR